MRASAVLLALLTLPLALPLAAASPTCAEPNSFVRGCADPDAPAVSWDSRPLYPPSPAPGVGYWLHADADATGADARVRDNAQNVTLDARADGILACATSYGTVEMDRYCIDSREGAGALPTVPTDPAVYVAYVTGTVDSLMDEPLVQCVLRRICPI